MVRSDALGFLFPGQGAQFKGMALDMLESPGVRSLFTLASEVQGRDMEELLKNADAETLKRSDISQPAITLANLAAAAYLAELGIKPRVCCGFSLGEYAALVSAGILTLRDCFTLVRERGKAMQDAADEVARETSGKAPGMAAVIGLSPEQVETLIARWKSEGLQGLYGANFNSPKQVVVSGTAEALEIAIERFKAEGARRVLPLQVAGPFHSPLMDAAAAAFAPILDKTPFQDPTIPCYSNVTGGLIRTGAEAKSLAIRQIVEPVRWTSEEAALEARGDLDGVVEVGPGRVLQGLWKDSGSGVPAFPGGSAEDIRGFMSQVSPV